MIDPPGGLAPAFQTRLVCAPEAGATRRGGADDREPACTVLWDIEEDGDPVTSRLRIIVTGLVAQYPVGGVAWDYLQYVIGFARLGHDVYYHEDTWCWPYHPVQQTLIDDCKYSAAYLKAFFEQYSPEHASRWHYLHLHETSCGMSRADFDQVARSADLFVNVSGASAFPENLSPHCVKVFLDTDPGYNQIVLSERPSWSENVDRWCANVFAHDHHFTYAENIDSPDCLVPGVGLRWQKTHMPVVGDLWKKVADTKPTPDAPWSTVMTWNVFKGSLNTGERSTKAKLSNSKRSLTFPNGYPDRSGSRLVEQKPRSRDCRPTVGWSRMGQRPP